MSTKVLCDLCTNEIPQSEDDEWDEHAIKVGEYKMIDACKPCIEWTREELLQKRIREKQGR